MNRLTRLIGEMSETELLVLQRQLDNGDVERLISSELATHRQKKQKICPVCGNCFTPQENMKLEFGPRDLRQQAFFDGPDCLEYFTRQHLRK